MARPAVAVAVLILAVITLSSGCITIQSGRTNKPPIAVLSPDVNMTTVSEGDSVILNGTKSVDRDGRVVRYHWDFGDGTEGTDAIVFHTYSAGGNYTVILVVTDNDGAKSQESITIHVNERPVARMGPVKGEAKVLEDVVFTGNESFDRDGSVGRYFWDFGDGANSTGIEVAHSYSDIGRYNVSLTVWDDRGAEAKRPATTFVSIILRTFTVSYPEVNGQMPSLSDYTRENETSNSTVTLTKTNITRFSLTLAWKDDIYPFLSGPNDWLRLAVSASGGDYKDDSSMTGNVSAVFSLIAAPPSVTVVAKTAAEALAAAGNRTSTKGTGEWAVSVTVLDAGDGFLLPDLGQKWETAMTYQYYEARVEEVKG